VGVQRGTGPDAASFVPPPRVLLTSGHVYRAELTLVSSRSCDPCHLDTLLRLSHAIALHAPDRNHLPSSWPFPLISRPALPMDHPHRPTKKRCQFRVVYNIPVTKTPSPTSETAPDVSQQPEAKPEMTANPTQCPSAALRVAGECPHCSRVFCGTHRTPEAHNW